MKKYSEKEWLAEGKRLFGENRADWRFECPSCSTTQSARDFMEKAIDKEKMKETIGNGVVGFSCIGRFVKDMGCDWTLGGFLQIHEAEVLTEEGRTVPVMEFASVIGTGV